MGDHFVLLVDRLLTESTLEAAIEGRNRMKEVEDTKNDCSSHEILIENESYPRKMVECRICQDEDLDLSMETPCSCRGSLKVCDALPCVLDFVTYLIVIIFFRGYCFSVWKDCEPINSSS